MALPLVEINALCMLPTLAVFLVMATAMALCRERFTVTVSLIPLMAP